MMKAEHTAYIEDYMKSQALAEAMIPMVGKLYRERGVIVTLFGRKLMNASTIDIIKAHRLGRHLVGRALKVEESHSMLQTMQSMNLGVSRIDIGKLACQYAQLNQDASSVALDDFLNAELASVNHGRASLVDKP